MLLHALSITRQQMKISSIKLIKFRCFESKSFEFDSNIVQILGSNGIGKTSLLESIYYSCYLRSFKTHIPKELANFDGNLFSIITSVTGTYGKDTISSGFENTKKFAKINNKSISSFKDIHDIFKVITITQSDIAVIDGSPLSRRSFIDHAIVLFDSEYLNTLSKYTKTLRNRNSLFFMPKRDMESYALWTSELLKISQIIQQKRIAMVSYIQHELNHLSKDLSKITDIQIEYKPTSLSIEPQNLTPDLIIQQHSDIMNKEYYYKRTLFGAHLDDLEILFNDKPARIYSSRGQQKLIIFLLKFAVIKHFHNLSLEFILLIDDFFSDFDTERSQDLLVLASKLASQIFITSPTENNIFKNPIFKSQILNLHS